MNIVLRQKINDNQDDYDEKYLKIKIHSDDEGDDHPSEKTSKIYYVIFILYYTLLYLYYIIFYIPRLKKSN